jgi:hypothetical protein
VQSYSDEGYTNFNEGGLLIEFQKITISGFQRLGGYLLTKVQWSMQFGK